MRYEHGGDIYSNRGVRLDFSVNLNPLGMPEFVSRAARESIARCAGYPDSECRALRRAVSGHYRLREESIIFGNGAAQLIYDVARAVRPERAVLTAPAFFEYGQALRSVGARIISFRLREEDGFAADWGRYLALLERERPQMIFLCNPANPAGTLEKRGTLKPVLEFCEENGIFAVVDECFLEFADHPEESSVLPLVSGGGKRLFVIRAITKTFAAAGLRLGYGFCGDERLLLRIASSRQPWSVSVPAEAAGLAAFGPEREEFLSQTRAFVGEEKRGLFGELSSAGFSVFASGANFLFFKDRADREPGAFYRHCLDHGILIRSCSNYEGLDGRFYRVCVGSRGANLELARVIRRY